jgi:NMD protein affecting ribosome stability and mRNA decay
MKPKKTKMCADCGKPKMVFKTEAEALKFIEYNGTDITDTPELLRVYHCDACGGYHVTSQPYKASYVHRVDDLINKFK